MCYHFTCRRQSYGAANLLNVADSLLQNGYNTCHYPVLRGKSCRGTFKKLQLKIDSNSVVKTYLVSHQDSPMNDKNEKSSNKSLIRNKVFVEWSKRPLRKLEVLARKKRFMKM